MPAETPDVAETSKELFATTDRLNREILAAEAALHALGLGITGEVPLNLNVPFGLQVTYGKGDNAWGLFIRDRDERRPLANASRADRVQATYRLDDLLDRLLFLSQSYTTDVKDAICRTEAFNERVRHLVDRT
jgi:hypothetical protein